MKKAKLDKFIIKAFSIAIVFGFACMLNSRNCCEKQFLEACENNNIPKAIEYLNNNIDINCQSSDKRTGLILATLRCNWPLCKLLINRKANIYHKDKYGWTAPMYAVYCQRK